MYAFWNLVVVSRCILLLFLSLEGKQCLEDVLKIRYTVASNSKSTRALTFKNLSRRIGLLLLFCPLPELLSLFQKPLML